MVVIEEYKEEQTTGIMRSVVEYAEVADRFAQEEDDNPSRSDDDGDENDDEKDINALSLDDDDESGPDIIENDDDDESSDDNRGEEEEEGQGSDEDGSSDEEEDNNDDDDDEEEESADDGKGESNDSSSRHVSNDPKTRNVVSEVVGDETCIFDVRNLLAMNTHQVDSSVLYLLPDGKGGPTSKEEGITIPASGAMGGVTINEEHLLQKASDGCAQLLGALWQLPVERSDAGPMVSLPAHFEIRTPRELPPPAPKKETKWEKFAKERGITLNKNKRSRKVWDEATGEWKYRTGYDKANKEESWPIMEVKRNDDPYDDPWEKARDTKRARVVKNMENRMRNQERAGLLPKGTATRTMKNLTAVREKGKKGGNKDRDHIPAGLPVDLKTGKVTGQINSMKRGKELTKAALVATQKSTASLGNFDAMREGEPERKKARAASKKRKLEGGPTDRKVIATETERGLKVLDKVINGGGAKKEKDKRSGRLAKGETAYDYDFDDGLGPSSFKKNKGRAGAGKMKKVTKKRAK